MTCGAYSLAITLGRASPQFRAPCCDSFSSPLFRSFALLFCIFSLYKGEIKNAVNQKSKVAERKRVAGWGWSHRAASNNTFLCFSLAHTRKHIAIGKAAELLQWHAIWRWTIHGRHNTNTRALSLHSLRGAKRERRLLTFSLSFLSLYFSHQRETARAHSSSCVNNKAAESRVAIQIICYLSQIFARKQNADKIRLWCVETKSGVWVGDKKCSLFDTTLREWKMWNRWKTIWA